VYQLREWLAVLEELGRRKVRYVYTQDSSRQVLGVVPFYLDPGRRPARYYEPANTLGASVSQKLSGGAKGFVVLGNRAGFMTGWSLATDHVDSAKLLACMVSLANRLAYNTDVGIFSIQFLPASEARLLIRTGLVDPENIVLQNVTARIALPGKCFEDYYAGLKRSRRHTIRRDLDRFAESGCTLDVTKLSRSLSYMPQLLANVQQFHDADGRVAQYRRLLQTHAKWLDKYGVVVTSRGPEGEPITFSLSYIVDNTLHVRMSGIDYGRAKESRSYFNAAYYGPIRLAYEHGVSHVELGIGALKPKVIRGARLEPLYGFFAGRDRGVLTLDDRRRVQQEVYQRLEEEADGIVQLPPFESISADVLAN
jgi:hypothetical protein